MVYVKLIVANPINNEIFKKQSFTGISCTGDNVENISEYYNRKFLEAPRADLYGFMIGDDQFTTDNSLKEFVSLFTTNLKMNGLIYSDKYLAKDNILIPQIYPPYSSTENIIFNPTIFVNGHIDVPIFDPNLSGLRSYDVIRKIGTAARILHIPKFLVTTKFSKTDIQKEIDYYVGKSN